MQTTHGAVRGQTTDGVSAFRGIPYAAPLDGVRRFLPPQPPEQWEGTRDATRYSADVPQSTLLPGVPSSWTPGDDPECLTVNVWTPDPGASGLPVMVWLYGGAYIVGTSRQPEYDGANLARGGVVVVSLNYRVGFEGFGWLPDSAGNRAFLDQLAALRWVQDNIRAFGGDPDNVTLFGESAGGTAVAALTAAEAGRGLFHRAIGQSVAGGFQSEDTARATAARIAAALGAELTAEAFGALPSEAIHGVQAVPGTITPFGPVIDGDVVAGLPWERLRGEVDLVVGFNRDEYRLFSANEDVTAKDPAATAAAVGASIDGYRTAYPQLSDPDLYVLIMSDAIFRMPTTWCAQNHPGRTFLYELTWPSPAFGGLLGCCHGLDLPLTFGNFDGQLGAMLLGSPVPPEATALSEEFRKAWTSFAATGDPGWPEYEPGERLARIWDTEVTVESDPEGASRRIWAH
ncbi:carboxylesterase/lipase family protein [Amycolatopsis sacchari]|uniref:Carboxylic ester hydrolase n=1 Tax=Amycolatopsis sacchari TaxID=115433 RepID=A0A1I3SIL7_9PSEU|nr:carboxylesterase family protein [Amycolatopsis sacchari]SFJ58513.1 para-nitrobenzyl esterase [Amycolatopsis sacchari]